MSNPISRFITRTIEGFLSKRLSARTKRMIYVSSILGIVAKERCNNVAFVEKVNMFLKLANRSASLMFPVYISGYIWRNCKRCKVHVGDEDMVIDEIQLKNIAADNYKELGDLFSSMVPSWLTYSTKEKMTKDVVNTLFISQKLSPA